MEELIFGQSRGQFAKSFREGDKFFILQLGSNTYSSFLLISELIHGCCKDSIVVPEGKSGSGWRGFGLHLQPRVSSFQASNHRYSQKRHFKNLCIGGGRGNKGKNKTAFVQNSNPRDTCKESIQGQREQLGAKILSTININGIESNGIKSELLTLDIFIFMRMDYGAWERKMGDGL